MPHESMHAVQGSTLAKEPDIQASLRHAEERSAALSEALRELEDRLHPVLRQDNSKAAGPGEAYPSASTPTGDRIERLSAGISSEISRVRSLLDLLEI